MSLLPDGFVTDLRASRRDGELHWFYAQERGLPELLSRLGVEQDPSKEVCYGFSGLILPCRGISDQTSYALKLCSDREAMAKEAACLRWWGGEGAVRLIAAEPDALLLEWLDEGQPAREEEVLELHRRLTQPMADLPADLIAVLPQADLPYLPPVRPFRLRRYLDLAKHEVSAALAALERRRQVRFHSLIHGDFGPTNIRRRDGRAVVIDPNPVIGDPARDLGQWLTRTGTPAGIDRLAAASGFERERIADWARLDALTGLLNLARRQRLDTAERERLRVFLS